MVVIFNACEFRGWLGGLAAGTKRLASSCIGWEASCTLVETNDK
jgi:hypothetical protein